MIMNKIIRLAVLLLCFCSCAIDNDAIYYPVGNVDVENGGPALEDGRVNWLPEVITLKIMCWTQ